MEHLKMHSMNKVDENVNSIAALFPNCVTEAKNEDGSISKKIDFDMLKQELSNYLIEGREERYQFTWPDKRKAVLTANSPINKTFRPCREESINFDETNNLYIEGDNLEALKLLQETYLGKVLILHTILEETLFTKIHLQLSLMSIMQIADNMTQMEIN